jgi:valyl-tRNA synthetase
MNGISPDPAWKPEEATTPLARWILDAANRAVAEATAALEAYRFDEYAAACYRFAWNGFCDWFIEFAKPVLAGPDGPEKAEVKGAAQHVLGTILRLLHPAIPFVTEELWDRFGYGPDCSLIRAPWPEAVAVKDAEAARAELDWVISLISEIRTARSELNVPPSVKVPAFRSEGSSEEEQGESRWRSTISRIAGVLLGLSFSTSMTRPGWMVPVTAGTATFLLDLGQFINVEAERARLAKARGAAESETRKIAAKLGNADFVARAPEEVVEENRKRLEAARAEMARLDAALARIAG